MAKCNQRQDRILWTGTFIRCQMENVLYTQAVKWKILVSSQWTCKFCPIWLQFYALFRKCIWWYSSTRENV